MTEEAKHRVLEHAAAGTRLREQFFAENADLVVDAARALAVCLARGGKILFCGNGGSAADAQHLAAEFVNRFEIDRPPLAAIALTTDTSILTAVGNDFDFNQVFAKQVQALGAPEDVLVGISTSGNSENVVRAFKAARENSLVTMAFTGRDGGKLAELSDVLINVPVQSTALIQEIHITVGHLLCRLVDYFLFQNAVALAPYLDGEGPGND
ncbi:Phosphoheptose isomerase [uncultured delta proteobacterium]|uniref:Phosphoheptose isomerase n=1 Tax=uncultured delta proteobacterium TaxID=34034 RepID=A0A212JA51_9DELT|nr:Phosphoheptose isomerase [uncultured delta proteobacterium]